jgi:hypothetical protein
MATCGVTRKLGAAQIGWSGGRGSSSTTATGARNRRFGPSSALRAHTETPYKNDLLSRTLRENPDIWQRRRTRNRPGQARTVERGATERARPQCHVERREVHLAVGR